MRAKSEAHHCTRAVAGDDRHAKAMGIYLPTLTAAVCLLLASEVLCGTAHAGQLFIDPMFDIQVTHNVPYGSSLTGNGVNQTRFLDVYRPVGPDVPDKLPAIVLMHGGYFIFGDKQGEDVVPFANAFASRGFVAASINYRLLFEDSFPEPPGAPMVPLPSRLPSWLFPWLEDQGITEEQFFGEVAAAVADQAMAVDWLVANADAYRVDPHRIAVGGSSAGAVSSILLGIEAVDGATADVGAVFSVSGGALGWESFVDVGDPGMFMAHGDQDEIVPFSEVAFLEAAYADAGLPYEKHIGEGIGHELSLNDDLLADPTHLFEFMVGQLSTPVPDALPGDINLDGSVDRTDTALFAQHFGAATASTWITGDFDDDGATTLRDLALLQAHIGESAPSPAASSAVPEPTGCTLLLCAIVVTITRGQCGIARAK